MTAVFAAVSDGACIAFVIVAGIAGLIVGALINETHDSATHDADTWEDAAETEGQQWGKIGAAATAAYRGAHVGLETLADARVWTAGGDNRVRLLIFSDSVLQGEQWWLDDGAARELLGVEPAEVLRRLIPA